MTNKILKIQRQTNTKNTKILDIFVILYLISCGILLCINKEYFRDVYLITVPIIGIVFFIGIKKNKNDFLIFCFYICNFTFLHGNFYLKLLKNKPLYGMYFSPYRFSQETQNFILIVLLIKVIAIYLARTSVNYLPKLFILRRNYYKKLNINLDKLYKTILVLATISIIYILKIVKITNSLGYLALYNGLLNSELSWWRYLSILVNLANYFILFYLVLLRGKVQNFRNILIIYFLISFIGSLAGGRGGIVALVFCFAWYLFRYFSLEVNCVKILITGILLISFCFFIANKREHNKIQGFESISIKKIEKFFEEQGESVTLLGFYKDYPKLKIKDKPMILSFLGGGPEKIYTKIFKKKYNPQRSFYNGERISSVVNYNLYKIGNGTGGNYLVEMLEVGEFIGIFILTLVYVFFLEFIQLNFFKMNIFFRMFSFLFIQLSFIAPRAHYLTLGITNIFYIVFSYYFIRLSFKK